MSRLRLRMLIALIVAVALAWGASPDVRAAAKAGAKAAAKAATTAATKVAATVASAAPQGKSKGRPATTSNACTVNGKTYKNCPPALQKQANREAARKNAARQKTGVSVKFAGVSPASTTTSALAVATASGAGPTALAAMTTGTVPDYFGAANWANSPLPVAGAASVSGGIRKFVDTLPGLTSAGANNLGTYIPLAVADTTTFPGSDFYRIGLKGYNHFFNTDIAPGAGTPVRGYFDMGNPADSNPHYLGPLILATRNRPTRVLFSNQMASDLQIPADTTYMGAGKVLGVQASEKRATLHLHGGNTPWISDGTTHTWVTPAGGDGQAAAFGFSKGFSFQNVPDMANNALVFPNPPSLWDGLATYYWTNQQSGRLMFYHDHAYGITRLNVYSGEAAGYLVVDPIEESALQAATAPGTIVTDPATGGIVTADLSHVIPLVIQDKTFVPDVTNQLPAQDPTWDIAKWGGLGSLWFPHVYSPNQNPADESGANGFGRYDWGPWFWPPQNPGTLLATDFQCTSAATPAAGWAFPPLMCPGVPFANSIADLNAKTAGVPNSPSSTPEAFMDTPIVNGTAYPTLQVAPAAYRFHVLNAANDRTINLGLYIAEPVTLSPVLTASGSGYTAPVVTIGGCTGGAAVAQVADGVDPVSGLPFVAGVVGITMTSQPSACTSPSFAITDATGTGAAAFAVMSTNTDVRMVPANSAAGGRALPNCPLSSTLSMAGGGLVTTTLNTPTGLPPNCWPLYTSAQGYTAGTFGENGNGTLSWGNSDGRAGGVPDPLTAGPPIIQIGSEGGLLPNVAVIPSTPVSYDYNKRSITVLNVLNHGLMLGGAERADIIVDFTQFAGKTLILYNDAPAPVPAGDPRLDYYTNDPDQSSTGGAPSTLAGYGPNTRTIMQIQVTGSNPNTPTFNAASLQSALPGIFAITQDSVLIPESAYPASNGGSNRNTYSRIQDTSIGFGGTVSGVTVTNPGSGYTAPPAVTIAAPLPPGVQATATAALQPVALASVSLTAGGAGYTSVPAVSFAGGGGSGAAATAVLSATGVSSVTVNSSSGYTSAPTVIFNPAGATATATLTGAGIASLSLTSGGSLYTGIPTVVFSGGGGTGAAASATLAPTSVGSLTLLSSTLFTSAPVVGFSGGGGSGAAAAATLTPTSVGTLTLTSGGSGYTSAPAVVFSAGTAAATAALTPTVIQTLALTAGGTGYTSAPSVSFTGGGGTAGATASLSLNAITLSAGGSGYTGVPTVSLTGGGGSGAAATAVLAPTSVASLTLVNGGNSYSRTTTVTIQPPAAGTQATATCTVNSRGHITSVKLTNPGSGYTFVPLVTFSGGGSGAVATAALAPTSVAGVTVTSAGSAYLAAPAVSFSGGGGTGAAATATMTVSALTLLSSSGYTSGAPVVNFTGGGGTGAAATATLAPTSVGTLTLAPGSSGYTSAPSVTISGGGGAGATASATLTPTPLAGLTLTNGGGGYSSAPSVTFTGGGGTATATASLAGAAVASLALTNAGGGYTSAPVITFTNAAGDTTGTGAAASATLGGSGITVQVTAPGSYTSVPAVSFSGGGGIASATAALSPAPVASLTVTSFGSGYTSAPTVSFSGGGGTGAAATAALTPTGVASVTVTNTGSGYQAGAPPLVSFAGTGAGAAATATVVTTTTYPMQSKAIQELFTLDYGRMNATLGVEIPKTNFQTQTTIPYGYNDPPTEIFRDGETQVWKITHNGVDTHFIHFHLFTVQVINRVGWDGAIKPPDPNEMSFKDTVRMNPLEDIIVALRPFKQTLPFAVPNSHRPLNPTAGLLTTSPIDYTNVDPNGNPANVVNDVLNFGWEYVWHCHILGHEENDMMRAMILAVAPQTPTVVPNQTVGQVTFNMTTVANTPNVADPTNFTILRATNPAGPWTTVGTPVATISGQTATGTFTDTGLLTGTTYYYQVVASNVVGYTNNSTPGVGYPNVSADSLPVNFTIVGQ